MRTVCTVLAALFWAGAVWADATQPPAVEATTVDGKKVQLFANGRWVYVDRELAAAAARVAAEYPENKTRPVESQGMLFGTVGRVILPGDKDYNRGSLNPKLR